LVLNGGIELDAIFGNKQVSKREYGIIAERNIRIPMSDGIKIVVDVFRPDVNNKKFPALVAMSAFNKDMQSARVWPAASRSRRIGGVADASVEAGPIDFFVKRGYVYIIGGVRGTGLSGGAYNYLGPKEMRDSYEVVEWAGTQPWCTGNVGMAGIGYFANHHAAVALMEPPHLKCIAPVSAFWDVYNYFWYSGGILSSGFLRWFISLANFDCHQDEKIMLKKMGAKGYRDAIAKALEDKDINTDPQLVEALKNPDIPTNGTIIDILLQPTWNDYWQDRAIMDYSKIKLPSYIVAAAHRPAAFYHWSEMKMPKKLLNCPPAYTDRPFYQFAWELLRWYDYWLKGIDTGIMDEPNIRLFVQGANEWLTSDDFPLPQTKFLPFNLHENRSLCEIEPWPEAESASYDDFPDNRGSLKYYTAPIVENTEVAGPILLNLYASCRGTDMNFVVNLLDTSPEGKETVLTHGFLKASHRELDRKKSKPWVAMYTHTNPTPLIPGQVYPLSINLNPAAFLLKAGHRLGLKIASTDDEPEDLTQVKMGHLSSQTPNTITIYHDARYPSHLLLPITRGNIIGTYASGGDISLKSKEFMKLE
jgi:predicted acyl esterase